MAGLTGVKPSASYQSLLRVNDNTGLDGTAEVIEDGAGNDSPLYLSTSEILVKSFTANSVGGGFDAATVTSYVSKINGVIESTFLVDIEDLLVSGTVKDVIGEDGVAAAYITQITTAINGIIYKAEMACTEAPAGSNTTADIDLVTNSAYVSEDAAYDSGFGASVILITAGAAYTDGSFRSSADGTDMGNCVSDYLYIVNGSGANSGGTYTAGKFVIKLYGASF
jgi:hypothetical protein